MELPANIDRVWHDDLCTECGACWGVCPKANIRVERARNRDYVFRVNEPDLCKSCGLCARVCPGLEVEFGALAEWLFPGQSPDRWWGLVRASYLCRSTDPEAVRRGASGGTVTTLLEFGLSTGRIDGALVVGMAASPPHEPRVFLARTAEELHSATQSKYCPAPTCMSFRDAMAVEGRYALVGLPCHVHALRKAQGIFPKLQRRIVLAIGLFCGPGPLFWMIDHLLGRRDVKLDEVTGFHFRDKRAMDGVWPGGILVETRSCGEVHIPLAKYLYAQTLFTRGRCYVCPDYASEFADLSVGDAHLHEFWGEPPTYAAPSGRALHGPDGWNTLLVRTEAGAEWLEAARAAGRLDPEPVPLEKLREGVAHALYRKKDEFWARLRLRAIRRGKLPSFPGLPLGPPLKASHYLKPILSGLILRAIGFRPVRWLLTHVPERWLLKKISLRQRLIRRALQGQAPPPGQLS